MGEGMAEKGRAVLVQFARYVVSGGLATLADWLVFYGVTRGTGAHYQLATVCAFSTGAVVNYTLSKLFVFRCTSRRIAEQFSVYAVITIASLLVTMGLMYIMVSVLKQQAMISRMIVTGVMLAGNYAMHKCVTFNARIFRPHEPQ